MPRPDPGVERRARSSSSACSCSRPRGRDRAARSGMALVGLRVVSADGEARCRRRRAFWRAVLGVATLGLGVDRRAVQQDQPVALRHGLRIGRRLRLAAAPPACRNPDKTSRVSAHADPALPPRRARGRVDPHLPGGGGRVREAGAPLLRRQGLDRDGRASPRRRSGRPASRSR